MPSLKKKKVTSANNKRNPNNDDWNRLMEFLKLLALHAYSAVIFRVFELTFEHFSSIPELIRIIVNPIFFVFL